MVLGVNYVMYDCSSARLTPGVSIYDIPEHSIESRAY